MGRITFKVKGYTITVSDHARFTVYSKSLPMPSPYKSKDVAILYDAYVGELEHGIENVDGDDINVNLESPIVEQAAREWIEKNEDMLKQREQVAIKKYERKLNRQEIIRKMKKFFRNQKL
jgi:hypothetical protein